METVKDIAAIIGLSFINYYLNYCFLRRVVGPLLEAFLRKILKR